MEPLPPKFTVIHLSTPEQVLEMVKNSIKFISNNMKLQFVITKSSAERIQTCLEYFFIFIIIVCRKLLVWNIIRHSGLLLMKNKSAPNVNKLLQYKRSYIA